MNKKILVLLKYSQDNLSPFDAAALECALRMENTDVTVLSMVAKSKENNLRSLTRFGVKVIMLSDPLFAGSDTYATSQILAKAISLIDYDFIFTGKQSTDGDTGQVPMMLSEILHLPILGHVKGLKNNQLMINDCYQKTTDKVIYTFDKFLTLRFPSIYSKEEEITIWNNQIINVDKSLCGLGGSLTRVIKNYENNQDRRYPKNASLDELDSLIKQGLKKSYKKEEKASKEKIDKIIYFGDTKKLANKLAKETMELKNDENIEVLLEKINKFHAKAIIFDDSFACKSLAAKLAIRLKAGLCADCVNFVVDGDKFIMVRPAFEGNIIADIVCTSEISLATVKTLKNSHDLIFCVGRGAIPYLDKIKKLAEDYNAELCATRDLVDLGIMPYSSQVGLTGKFIYPKVYVTFGVSGAIQHTCGIAGCGTIISINKDSKAKIYTYSDYKIVDDLKNL